MSTPASSRRLSHRPRVRRRQRVDDASHDLRARCGRRRPCAVSAAAAIRCGISPGARNAGSSTSITARPRQRRVRQHLRASLRSPHSRRDSCSNHSPPVLRRKRVVPSMPPSFVKFAARASAVSTAPPAPARRATTSRSRCTRTAAVVAGTPTTADAVSCERHRVSPRRRRASAPRRTPAARSAAAVAGMSQPPQQLSRPVPRPHVERAPSSMRSCTPSAARPSASRRAGRAAARCAPPPPQFAALLGRELVDRVERQELQRR